MPETILQYLAETAAFKPEKRKHICERLMLLFIGKKWRFMFAKMEKMEIYVLQEVIFSAINIEAL